jgi:type IV pilus assembly protein PilV
MQLRRYQLGVSLVESLVALVVMSIGMLGVAGLYVESVRSNRTALIRTNAVYLVNDLADRIRANRRGREEYAKTPQPIDSVPNCAATDCTPAQLAAYDLAHWQSHVQETLPKAPDGTPAKTTVTFTAGDPDRYEIVVEWVEPGDTSPLTARIEIQQSGIL